MFRVSFSIALALLTFAGHAIAGELPTSSNLVRRNLSSKSDKKSQNMKKEKAASKSSDKMVKRDKAGGGSAASEESDDNGKKIYKIYLSGPEVFLADPVTAGEEAKASCEEANDPDADFYLEAVYPLDNVIENFAHDQDTGIRIYYANIELMDNAFGTASNMIRFRSPSMDVGTAFEMGYIKAQGKPVFGYYDAIPFYGAEEEPGEMRERVFEYGFTEDPTDRFDKNNHEVEDFKLTDNLMMTGAITDTGYYPPRKNVYESCVDAVEYIKNNM